MSTQATLQLDLSESNLVNIAITDLSGRTIAEVMNENLSAGTHTLNIQTPDLATGMYFLLVRTGSENRMIKITIE